MNLVFKDVCIRNAEKADCQQLADWWNDGKVMAHAGFPNGLGTTAEEVAMQIAAERDDRGRTLIIESGGKPIGEMSYHCLEGNVAEIGIKICNSAYQGKGLGPIALHMLIEELFSTGFAKIILDTNLNNKRAQHVYENLGFHKLRVNVDSWEDQLGVMQSSVDYELSAEEFRERKQRNGKLPVAKPAAIKLSEITEDNWLKAASLSVKDAQKDFVAPAVGILARGYVYRNCNSKVFVIENDEGAVGLALVREFDDEPLGYDLQQFMIDQRHQGQGYGSAALGLILDELRKEGHYDHVEVCVKKADIEAIRLYEKHGFVDSGYIDDNVPDSINLICQLSN